MKTYTHKSKDLGLQVSIPDGWSALPTMGSHGYPSGDNQFLRAPSGTLSESTLLGPHGESLHILLTVLPEGKPEPTIAETEEYFDGLTYRENLNIIATGTIRVAGQEHFWATYYRMTLLGPSQIQFFKKYCLYLKGVECLLTAGLCPASAGRRLPTDQMIKDSERVHDEIILSIRLVDG